MFETANNSTPNIKNHDFQSSFGRVNYFKAARISPNAEAESSEESNRSVTGMPSQATPKRLKKDPAVLHQTDIQYSIHEETGKTMVKIVNKENNEVIREIPSRGDLERSARLQAYIGRLFDTIA
jgi:flagellar protein FlaG